MSEILDFVKSLIPPALFERVLEYGWDMLLLVLAVFSFVQVVKITARYTVGKPRDWLLHLASVLSAAVLGFAMGPGESLAQRAAAALIAWLITYAAATYGLALIKWRWPALWAAINLDRRRPGRREPLPGGLELRRRGS